MGVSGYALPGAHRIDTFAGGQRRPPAAATIAVVRMPRIDVTSVARLRTWMDTIQRMMKK